MSVRPEVDLDVFARDRGTVPPPRRRPLRVLVPLAVALAFLGVLWWSADRFLTDPVRVTVIRPVQGEATLAAGSQILQAAGWIAPEPFPIRVTALAEGVVEELLAREADAVETGQPVARLVAADAELALAGAEAALQMATAAIAAARAEAETAELSLAATIELEEARASAAARLAGLEAEERKRAAAVDRARAMLGVAKAELETQRFLREEGVEGPWQIELAEARLEEATAEVAFEQASLEAIAAERDDAVARLARVRRDLETRFEDKLRVEKAKAALAGALAERDAAAVMRDEAALRLERMTVRSPASGIVLERLAMPGSAVGPAPDAALLTLYDPSSLRVRVDVPQDRVAQLVPGTAAEVVLDARRDRPYRGEVTRVVHEADIQKTTLEVQVRILDPDGLPRPEMLAQVRFLAPEVAAGGEVRQTLVLPARVVENGSVWVVDGRDGRARKRSVQARPMTDGRVAIVAGLNASDKVIDEGRAELEEGAAITIGETE